MISPPEPFNEVGDDLLPGRSLFAFSIFTFSTSAIKRMRERLREGIAEKIDCETQNICYTLYKWTKFLALHDTMNLIRRGRNID